MESSIQEEFKRTWLVSIIGLLLFCAGLYIIICNEMMAVHRHNTLDVLHQDTISIDPDDGWQPENDGKLIHVTGNLIVKKPITDPEYGIAIAAARLKRRVQTFQWVEMYQSNDQEPVTQEEPVKDYYYVTEWRDKLVDSSSFYIRQGHENPTELPLKTQIYTAASANIGKVTLSKELLEEFKDFEVFSGDQRPDRDDVKLHLGIYYHCRDLFNPEVGDFRIQFYYAGGHDEPVSVVARYQHDKWQLVPHQTPNGQKVVLVKSGTLNKDEIFAAAHKDVKVLTWTLRFLSAFSFYAATLCCCKLLNILFGKVPGLENLLSGSPHDFNNFFFAVSLNIFFVSLAWIIYRPILGASLIFASLSPLLYCIVGGYR